MLATGHCDESPRSSLSTPTYTNANQCRHYYKLVYYFIYWYYYHLPSLDRFTNRYKVRSKYKKNNGREDESQHRYPHGGARFQVCQSRICATQTSHRRRWQGKPMLAYCVRGIPQDWRWWQDKECDNLWTLLDGLICSSWKYIAPYHHRVPVPVSILWNSLFVVLSLSTFYPTLMLSRPVSCVFKENDRTSFG